MPDVHDTGGQGVARDVASGAAQQGGRAVERHAKLILTGDLHAPAAAGAEVLDAMVLQYAHLLEDDLQLLADLGTDLQQRVPVMDTYALGIWQLVAHDLAVQRRVQWLASALLALMAGNRVRLLLIGLGLRQLLGGRELLGLVEEQLRLRHHSQRSTDQVPDRRGRVHQGMPGHRRGRSHSFQARDRSAVAAGELARRAAVHAVVR